MTKGLESSSTRNYRSAPNVDSKKIGHRSHVKPRPRLGNPSERKAMSNNVIDINVPNLREMYFRAQNERKRREILMMALRKIYSPDEIVQDQKKMQEMESVFIRQDTPIGIELKKLADVLEIVFADGASKHGWLGESAHAIITSKFDDVINGVDTVIEFKESEKEASHLALGIDVTFGRQIGTKLQRIRRDINDGALSSVKYFESKHIGQKGGLQNIPRVAVGASKKTVAQVAKLWFENNDVALKEHPIQYMLLREMEMQLEAYVIYAQSIGKTNIAEIYQQSLLKVQAILKEKSQSLNLIKTQVDRLMLEDAVFQDMKIELGRWVN